MSKPTIKSDAEIKLMAEGGKKLGKIKKALFNHIKPGVSAHELEVLANKLINESGGKSSFKEVSGYSWATCINVNDGVVHGIPHKSLVFNEGDVVSLDIGLIYKGYHTDTSITKLLGNDPKNTKLLESGQRTLKKAIKAARPGATIGDISRVFQTELEKDGLNPIRSLTGHGIGRKLHEAPLIPCYVSGSSDEKVKIVPGMALAIEIMYTSGSHEVKIEPDGWTIRTRDGKISALFEETVAITSDGPIILTN